MTEDNTMNKNAIATVLCFVAAAVFCAVGLMQTVAGTENSYDWIVIGIVAIGLGAVFLSLTEKDKKEQDEKKDEDKEEK